MSNALTKADIARKRLAFSDSLASALRNGGPVVWLSCLIMGLGNIMAGQFIKGLLFLAIEAGVIAFLADDDSSFVNGERVIVNDGRLCL